MAFTFSGCEKDYFEAKDNPDSEKLLLPADNSSNECERQKYLFQGGKIKIEILRCSPSPEDAKASITKEDLRMAVLNRFNALTICNGHDCNNTANDCVIGSTTGQVNGTVASCDPTGEICEESGNPIFKITIEVTKYAVNVMCDCKQMSGD